VQVFLIGSVKIIPKAVHGRGKLVRIDLPYRSPVNCRLALSPGMTID
jgi:hypothetical protein